MLMSLLALQADGPDGQAACDELGIEVLPTLQFWRDGQLLWEHRGVLELEQDLGEGETEAVLPLPGTGSEAGPPLPGTGSEAGPPLPGTGSEAGPPLPGTGVLKQQVRLAKSAGSSTSHAGLCKPCLLGRS